jgi:putative membrane protein
VIVAPAVGRFSRWLAGVTAMVLATVVVVSGPAQAFVNTDAARAAADIPLVPDTALSGAAKGVVTPADRDFVIKVRLASTLEIPAGTMAELKGSSALVPRIGRSIAEQNVRLEQLAREAAAKLGIPLPAGPTAEQQSWLREMRAATGQRFDQLFVDILRGTHGKSLQSIAHIRAGTRNDVVRRLAQQANQFELTDMTMLESSGLVDYGALPAAPQPAADGPLPDVNSQAVAAAGAGGGVPLGNRFVALIVLFVALLVGIASTVRVCRRR